MRRLAILIHAHTNSEQVARLVSCIKHPKVDIYINVDKKTEISDFKNKISDVYFLTNREKVYWGQFSQVQQILNSFREIRQINPKFSHLLFISGQDYPTQPIEKIIDFLERNPEKNYVDFHKLGSDNWSSIIKKRYEYWHFLPVNDLRNNAIVKKILLKFGFKRTFPFPEIYYGSCWFCLTPKAINYILNFTLNNPKIINFFKHSGCSDELFIQSLLLNSPLRDSLENETFRYFDWTGGGKSPKVLTINDFSKIEKSETWFARKLDISVDTKIFDLLDNLRNKKGEL